MSSSLPLKLTPKISILYDRNVGTFDSQEIFLINQASTKLTRWKIITLHVISYLPRSQRTSQILHLAYLAESLKSTCCKLNLRY